MLVLTFKHKQPMPHTRSKQKKLTLINFSLISHSTFSLIYQYSPSTLLLHP